MPEWAVEILRSYGLAGLVIAGLVWAVISLWNRNIKREDAFTDLAINQVRAVETNTAAINRLTDYVRDRSAGT